MTRYIDIPGFAPTVYAPPDPSLTDGHLLLLIPGKPIDGYWGSGNDIPNLAAANNSDTCKSSHGTENE